MEPKSYERMVELWELKRMRQERLDANGCECSLCRFFPEFIKKYQ